MHPVLFQAERFTLYTYGVFAALAAAAAYLLALRRARAFSLPRSVVTDLFFVLFVAGVAGGRLFYVWQHGEDYHGRIWQAFSLREGGLVWYGGFIMAVASGIAYAFFRGWPILVLADFFAPFLALAHAIGRIGCFLNGCCFGRPSRLPWAVLFPGDPVRRHPTQLYESALLAALFFFLWGLSGKKRADGVIFTAYLFFYSAFRFGLEYLRGDQTPVGVFTLAQWTSLFFFAASIVSYLLIEKKKQVRL